MKILYVNDIDNNNYAFELNSKTVTGFLMELFKKNLLTIEQISKFIPMVAESNYEEIIRSDEITDITLSDHFHILEVKDEWKEDCIWINL